MTGLWPIMVWVGSAVAVTPVTAGWAAALLQGRRAGWWLPRAAPVGVWAQVAAVTVPLVLAGDGRRSGAGVVAAGDRWCGAGGVVLVVRAGGAQMPGKTSSLSSENFCSCSSE